MTNSLFSNIMFFISVVLVQVLILNNINFFDTYNPLVYVVFILLYPVDNNRFVFLTLSFVLGLTIDIFSDTGGIHAAACTTIAYIRPIVLKSIFGFTFEHQSLRFKSTPIAPRILYFSILILIHHLILFILDIFNLSYSVLILQKTFFTTLFTLLIISLTSILFRGTSK